MDVGGEETLTKIVWVVAVNVDVKTDTLGKRVVTVGAVMVRVVLMKSERVAAVLLVITVLFPAVCEDAGVGDAEADARVSWVCVWFAPAEDSGVWRAIETVPTVPAVAMVASVPNVLLLEFPGTGTASSLRTGWETAPAENAEDGL